jgi:hypothetical protein
LLVGSRIWSVGPGRYDALDRLDADLNWYRG